MDINAFYEKYSSDCTAGSANQVLARYSEPAEFTGRCYYRLSHGGESYSLLFSNRIDSTYSDGSISRANDAGGEWEIREMRVGLCGKSWDEPERWHIVTFDGRPMKKVTDAEPFFTDPIPLNAKGGQSLCYEITLYGACFPYHEEIVLPVKIKKNGEFQPDKRIPVPLMIGSDRAVERRIGFIGDSITQGCGTAVDSYTHWAAKIAERLPESYSVWDLGIGYARGYDAATDCGWLARAKKCDTVNVCFGVNDLLRGRTADEVLGDLETIIHSLKKAGCVTVIFTVPPFDMTGQAKEYWYEVNKYIREKLTKTADKFFDFAAVLGKSAPEEHISVYGGHPNAEGCLVAAKAYIEQGIL